MESRTTTRLHGSVAFTILAFAGLFGPILGIAFLLPRIGQTPLVVEPNIIPEETVVVTREVVDERVVEVVLSGPEPMTLTAGMGSGGGVVTELFVNIGDTVVNGRPIAAIDGEMLLAASSRVPFYRDLRIGSKGPDVRELQEWLATLAYLPWADVDGSFGAQTAASIKDMNRDRGVINPPRTFSPSDVVWLPATDLRVADIVIRPGSPAPGHGDPILTTERAYDRVVVRLPNGRAFDFAGSWDLLVDEIVVGTVIDDVVTVDSLQELANRAIAGLAYNSSDRDPGNIVMTALIRRSTAQNRNIVPVGTVVSRPSGADGLNENQCLFVANDGGYEPFRTKVVGGDFGVLYIEPAPPDDVLILVNPLAIFKDPSCT